MLRKGWTLGSPQLVRLMHGVIRLYHRPTVRLLEKFWRGERPDLVVSLVPNFNRAMGESALAEIQPADTAEIDQELAPYRSVEAVLVAQMLDLCRCRCVAGHRCRDRNAPGPPGLS